MREDAPTCTYRDILITYDETRDKWLFVLRGKERSADTLANAKKAIDAPPPKDDHFRRFEAWYNYGGYGANYHPVTVTSMTESGRFWITYTRNRSKERTQGDGHALFPCNPHNDAVVARIKAKNEELKVLQEELSKIREELKRVEQKDYTTPPEAKI